MKKFIIVGYIALVGLGCKTVPLQSNYSNLPRNVLEEKTRAGDLQAAFWLGDMYLLGKGGPQDTQKAWAEWKTARLAFEKEPALISQTWFKKAYQNNHPLAIVLELIAFGTNPAKIKEPNEHFLQSLGKIIDKFLLSQEQYPQYNEFLTQEQELSTFWGEIAYTIGQRYYATEQMQNAYLWADRACKLKNKDGCILAMKTF
ncbi:MAG: SEL1-like repeat protein [Elusimicrobiaceae bacterium]|nr:SEL1-like repeat protein [Elusimicrobiaceae bacterium]